MMGTELFLIRHGLTEWNEKRRYCGARDVPLSTTGRRQAQRLVRRLAHIKFSKIYSSDRKRALETCRIIFGKAGHTRVSALREIDFGALEGLRHKEVIKKYPHAYRRWLNDPYRYDLPAAERMSAFKKRVTAVLKKIASAHPGERVAVVCHGGVIGVLVSSLRKSRNFWGCVPRAASITVVVYRNGKPRIKEFNKSWLK